VVPLITLALTALVALVAFVALVEFVAVVAAIVPPPVAAIEHPGPHRRDPDVFIPGVIPEKGIDVVVVVAVAVTIGPVTLKVTELLFAKFGFATTTPLMLTGVPPLEAHAPGTVQSSKITSPIV
jgi:hypothetical protein